MRSQPIEHDAQEARTAARSSSAERGRLRPEVAARERGERVEGEQVRERAHAAVLRGGGAERARAQVLGRGQHGGRVGDGALVRRAHGDRLQPLGAHHRAEPAAARVAAVVRDRGEADELLARRPDRRDAVRRAEPLAQPRLGARRRAGPRGRPRSMTRAPCSSTTSAPGASHAPRTTIASFPVSLPAIAKWLEASASFKRSVSGDLATTANFALVVSGVPTSGEKTNASGAPGASGSTPGGAQLAARGGCRVRRRRSSRAGRRRRAANGSLPPPSRSTTSALPK